jgi:hypothetical protein
MLWCTELDLEVIHIDKEQERIDNGETIGLLREGYIAGKRSQITETQDKIRNILYTVFKDNKNQIGGIIND